VCDSTNTCHFQQDTIAQVFGSQGLALEGCVFGECITQAVIDTTNATSSAATTSGGTELSGGVIAGLAVVGSLIALGLAVVAWGWFIQRAAKKLPFNGGQGGGISVQWSDVSYIVQPPQGSMSSLFTKPTIGGVKTILDSVSGGVEAGQFMAILGPSGAGKTTLIELIAGKTKSGKYTGSITFPPYPPGHRPRVAFVPQDDILPSMLTVREALAFAASLRLPESLTASSKAALVSTVISKLGLDAVAETRIGATDGTGRGISGGEARRVSIGLELIGCPDVLVCDEPTSGLDSVSAWRVVNVLKEVARGGGIAIGHQDSQGHRKGVAVICSVHQPSSRLYHAFDSVILLSNGRALYSGPGGLIPAQYFMRMREEGGAGADVPPYEEGYNVADYLLEISSESPNIPRMSPITGIPDEKGLANPGSPTASVEEKDDRRKDVEALSSQNLEPGKYAATFLTQLQVLCGREWKILRRCDILTVHRYDFSLLELCRDKTLFFTHLVVACVLGVFCGAYEWLFVVRRTMSNAMCRWSILSDRYNYRRIPIPNWVPFLLGESI
jgi:ABC-type multidrug transport system ATPase subunit